jgi:cytochrome c oxidase assembly protein subunit 15
VFLQQQRLLRASAVASVVANCVLVLTGGVVRLTGSGLGCPTWPRCTDDSYVTTGAMGIHGAIEFGNRMLIFVLTAVAAIGLIVAFAQRRRTPRAFVASVLVVMMVVVQAVVGGVTVRMALNPWIVATHFLLSIVTLAFAFMFWNNSAARYRGSWNPPGAVRHLARLLTAISAIVLVIGTVVTGSGPHAGDTKAARTGFNPQDVAQLHTDAVFLLIGLSAALWFALRAIGAPRTVSRAAAILVLVELAQGVIGFVQYFTHLPVAVVAAHLLGASLVWVATLNTLAAASPRPAAVAVPGPTQPNRENHDRRDAVAESLR